MTTTQFWIFIAGLTLPSLVYRSLFALNRLSFYSTPLREKSGLNIHHGHYGYSMMLVSFAMLSSGIHNWFSIGLGSFGCGLTLDEIIPMLKMPSKDRDKELDVYGKAKKATIILIGTIVALAILTFWMLH